MLYKFINYEKILGSSIFNAIAYTDSLISL